ncbi:unnamed protein product, partial [Ostreobium quekettii]
ATDRTQKRTYTHVVKDELGATWETVIRICILFGNAGILIVFIIVIGDILVGTTELRGLIPALLGPRTVGTLLSCRWFVMLVATLALILPLVSLRNISSLEFASTTGVAVAAALSVLGIILSTIAVASGGLSDVEWWIPKGSLGMKLIPTTFGAISTYVFAYFVNQELPPLMEGLRVYTRKNAMTATLSAMALCFVIHVLVQVPMYVAFGSNTKGDILLNLTPAGLAPLIGAGAGEFVGDAVLICYAIKVIAIFPMINWPLRESLSDFIFRTPRPEGWRFYSCTYGILAVVYLIAVFVRRVTVAIDYVGSTAGVAIAFLAPAFMIYNEAGHRKGSKIEAAVFLASGILVFLSTFSNNI